jgi:hypothetical protein
VKAGCFVVVFREADINHWLKGRRRVAFGEPENGVNADHLEGCLDNVKVLAALKVRQAIIKCRSGTIAEG